MKRGWVWVALLLSVGINIGVLATIGVSRMRAEARWERPRDAERQPPFERLADHLELEGEARLRFIEIQQGLFRSTRQRQEGLHQLRAELRREIAADEPDPQTVDRLLDQIGAMHMDLDRALVESVMASKKILNPAQQTRYLRILERMREGYRRMGGRPGSSGPPRPRDRRPPPPDQP